MLNKNIDTDLLRTFVTIVDTNSFTRTGEKLLRSQSAISMQVKRLERNVGAEIFDRRNKSICLTRAGTVLLEYAKRMLDLSDEAYLRISDVNSKGLIRLGTPDDFAHLFLPIILSEFSDEFPHMQVEMICANSGVVLEQHYAGEIDIALAVTPNFCPKDKKLREEKLVWVCSEEFEVSHEKPLPLIMFTDGCICRNIMSSILDSCGMRWYCVFTSESVSAVHSAVQNGLGITAIGESTLPDGVRILGCTEDFPPLPSVNVIIRYDRNDLFNAGQQLVQKIATYFQ